MAGVGRSRNRLCGFVALSLIVHALVLAWLARQASPQLLGPQADLAVLSVTLVKPFRPEPAQLSRPATRPDQPRSGPAAPTEAANTASPGLQPQAPAAPGTTAPPGLAGPDALRGALRASVGCARASFNRLSPEEQQACTETLGRRAAATQAYAAPIDPEKRAYFDQVAAAYQGAPGQAAGGGVSPGAVYVPLVKCSVLFGPGRKPKDRQGDLRLGSSPCGVKLQGSWLTPEANVRRR